MGKKSAQADKTAVKAGSDASHVLLPNGTKVPVALPPGVNPETAKQVIEYLKQNPEAAQQSYLEAQRILHTPGMAETMLKSQTQTAADPAYQERLAAMQDDPDLKNVFDDIKANGAGAMEKYWNDSELMTKISEKMGGIRLQTNKSVKGAVPQKEPQNLHEAAKAGDIEAARKLLNEGADVNTADARGITALGLAVGYNKVALVKVLLEGGADVSKTDTKGSTVLHYAAGYGRKEAAELLLDAGADMKAKNDAGQLPIDAARVNREMHMVKYLKSRGGDKSTEGSKYL
ncbi:hypothetical protein ABBQ32_006924 [Trebouxia sp. C0010 RCD-2024]